MKLTRETVKKAYGEFASLHGWPPHADTDDKKKRMIDLAFREFARVYTEESFEAARRIAWNQARKFPVPADFHRGWEAPAEEDFDAGKYGLGDK